MKRKLPLKTPKSTKKTKKANAKDMEKKEAHKLIVEELPEHSFQEETKKLCDITSKPVPEEKEETIEKKYIIESLSEWVKTQVEKAPSYIKAELYLNTDTKYKQNLMCYFSKLRSDFKNRASFMKCWRGTEDELSLCVSKDTIESNLVALLLNAIDRHKIRDNLVEWCNQNNLEFDKIYDVAGEKLWAAWAVRLSFLTLD